MPKLLYSVMWTNIEINLMLSCIHSSDQCQPISYRFPICCSIKPSAALKGETQWCSWWLGMTSQFPANWESSTFTTFIHFFIYLEMKFESWSWLISFMLPPEWTVNKCYITLTQPCGLENAPSLFQCISRGSELLHILFIVGEVMSNNPKWAAINVTNTPTVLCF